MTRHCSKSLSSHLQLHLRRTRAAPVSGPLPLATRRAFRACPHLDYSDRAQTSWSSTPYRALSSRPPRIIGIRRDVSADATVSSANSAITRLAAQCKIQDARRVFDQMPTRDVVSWTAMMSAYIHCRMLRDARLLFDHPSAIRNVVTWTAMLSAYARAGRVRETEALFQEMPERNIISWNTMMSAYADRGRTDEALRVFQEMPARNVVSWNTALTALGQARRVDEALSLFRQMEERDVISWTAMVAALAQNGRVDEARALFDDMPERNVVSWNAMISGYSQNKRLDEAMYLFEMMPERDIPSWNAMITGMIQNGELSRARALFDEMTDRNVVTWTSLLTGYLEDGQSEEALRVFRGMLHDGVRPNQGTYVTALAAVSDLASSREGKQIHQMISKTHLQRNEFVASALISMYAKCGEIVMATQVFDQTTERDLVSWNSMIAAYSHHGHGMAALQLFEKMKDSRIKPDGTTYVAVLSACSHSGLVEKGLQLFESLLTDGSIAVKEDHYACLVDLFGRSGRLEDVANLIDKHNMGASSACVWGALLAGCNVHGNVEIGKLAARRLMETEPGNAGTYVLLSNMYAHLGKWKEATKVRIRMKDKGLKKQPGCSWIEVGNMVHVFVVRDKSHKHRESIYQLLMNLHLEMMGKQDQTEYEFSLDADHDSCYNGLLILQ